MLKKNQPQIFLLVTIIFLYRVYQFLLSVVIPFHEFIKTWRFKMNKSNMCILKGLGIILIAGIAIGCVGNKMMHRKKCLHKKANKAVHAMGDLVENVQHMFK